MISQFRRWLQLACVGAMLAACTPSTRLSSERDAERSLVEVSVVRDGDDWIADFHFTRSAPAWGFYRSGLTRVDKKSWRPQAWTVETGGVRLDRWKDYDVLVGTNGTVPSHVRIRFTPFAGDLLADYDPALVFTNGAVALFSDQFDSFPIDNAEAVESAADAVVPTRATFRDRGGKVLQAGERRLEVSFVEGQTYVLFGPARIADSPDISTVIDPELPMWLSDELAASTPRLLAQYAARLGPRMGAKPTLMVSWAGPTKGLSSQGGSVLPGLVMMAFEGDRVMERNPQSRDRARWFIAHETAHFWLGQTIRYEARNQAWITEGGADLLAARAVAAVDPTYDPLPVLQARLNECVKLSAGKPIRDAATRNEQEAYYACGTIFGLVAEKASGEDFFTFWHDLIDDNRDDGVVSGAEWLEMLTRVSGKPALAAGIAHMLDQGDADPAARLTELFDAAGVPYRRESDGNIRLL